MNATTNYTLAPRVVSSRMCGCIGPQNGQPRCPCMMQNMKVVNGRWVEVIDHGPVHTTDHAIKAAFEWGTEKILKEAIAKMGAK